MKKVSLKRLSALSVALLAVSAVVAAFVPSNSKKSKLAANGVLTPGGGVATADTDTCVTLASGGNCNNTVTEGEGSANPTSSEGGSTTLNGQGQPDGNTTGQDAE